MPRSGSDRGRASQIDRASINQPPPDATPRPLHSRYPLTNCGVCWADVKGGDDPFEGREDERPPGWWDIYNRQKRTSERPNACGDNFREWTTGDLQPGAEPPVTHPDHPRRLINSHANQDRFDIQLRDVLGGAP